MLRCLLPVDIFNDSGVYLILVDPHLYLHGRRIGSDLYFAEMVKEKYNAQTKSHRIGDFKNRKAVGSAA